MKFSSAIIVFVVTAAFTSWASAQEVKVEKVSYKDLVANLYIPEAEAPLPAIIVTGGSEGGMTTADAMGPMLAKAGFVVLGMAYFGAEGLPETLDRIPLEPFFNAIDHLQSLSIVDRDKIGFTSGSKGAELALLVASMDKRIKAVSAFTPSSVVFQSARYAKRLTSSWTYQGEDIPFVPYKGNIFPEDWRDLIHLFNATLTQKQAVERASIKVENINGPIQLISASKDEIWPSTKMSISMQSRLLEHDFPHAVSHLAVNTGHGFSKEWAPKIEKHITDFFTLHFKG